MTFLKWEKNEIHNEKHREKKLCLLNIYAHHIHTIANQKGQMPIAHNRKKQNKNKKDQEYRYIKVT